MNWYKLIKIAEVRGEFWIDDSGNVMEASGDGDFNHAGYVLDYAQHALAEYDEDYELWKRSKTLEIIEEKKAELEEQKYEIEVAEQDTTAIDAAIEENWEQSRDPDYYTYDLLFENLSQNEKELLNVAEGITDAREFAMKKWGWKRLEGKHVETWTLTPRDLEVIASGLYEAYGAYDEDALESETFHIYVFSTKAWYQDVSWQDISKKNIRDIMNDRMAVG